MFPDSVARTHVDRRRRVSHSDFSAPDRKRTQHNTVLFVMFSAWVVNELSSDSDRRLDSLDTQYYILGSIGGISDPVVGTALPIRAPFCSGRRWLPDDGGHDLCREEDAERGGGLRGEQPQHGEHRDGRLAQIYGTGGQQAVGEVDNSLVGQHLSEIQTASRDALFHPQVGVGLSISR